jgi:hypothetical protein
VYVAALAVSDGSIQSNSWTGARWAGIGTDTPHHMIVDNRNYMYIVGQSTSSFPNAAFAGHWARGFTNQGGSDGFLLVLDDSGNRVLNLGIGTPLDDAALSVAVDGNGGIYVVS